MQAEDIDYEGSSDLSGPARLWGAVLQSIFHDLSHPEWRYSWERARLFVLNREGNFDLMAQCLGEYPEGLQRRIMRALKSKGIAIKKREGAMRIASLELGLITPMHYFSLGAVPLTEPLEGCLLASQQLATPRTPSPIPPEELSRAVSILGCPTEELADTISEERFRPFGLSTHSQSGETEP